MDVITPARLQASLWWSRTLKAFNFLQGLSKQDATQIERDGRVIIPLPHPSGASTWYQKPAHRARLKQAIRLIRQQREALGL